MRKFNLLTVAVLLLSPCCSLAQPRVFLTGSGHAVPLPTARGQQVVMASVSLGTTDKPLTISKIEVVGTMTTNPDLEESGMNSCSWFATSPTVLVLLGHPSSYCK